MRILVVDHNAVEPLNQKLYRLISESGDSRVRVVVPAAWHDGYAMRRGVAMELSERFDVVPVPVAFPTRTHRLIYRGLARLADEFAPDILYANAEPENFQTYQCARILRRHPRARLVFSSWRNIDYAGGRFPYRFSILHRSIERRVLAKAAHGIAFNGPAASIFQRLGFHHMTVILPEIDTGVFAPAGSDAARPFTIGYAGRLEAQKGIDLLIAAAAGLPGDARLRIIGSGNARGALRTMAGNAGMGGRIEWISPVRRSAMPAEYARMDVLVLPSRTERFWKEQFGRVLVEAMACGVPVVGSDSGEIPAVVGDAGLIFQEGDIGGLRGALERLMGDASLRKALADRGLARVRERHAVETVSLLYHNLFVRLAGNA